MHRRAQPTAVACPHYNHFSTPHDLAPARVTYVFQPHDRPATRTRDGRLCCPHNQPVG